MPPNPGAIDHESDLADLSDRDVELLHQIVLRAQQSRDVQKRPKRALFEAYEKVFSENGRHTRQDRACLRIILQLGEPQIPGELLYDKFEFVLQQLGVTLAFGDDDSATPNDGKDGRPYRAEETFPEGSPSQPPAQPRRRASFASTHEVTNEQMRPSKTRHWSRASESQLLDERERPSLLQRKSTPSVGNSHTKYEKQGRLSDQQPTPNRHGMKKPYSERIRPPVTLVPPSLRSVPAGDQYQIPHAEAIYSQPSENDLDPDAEAFDDMRSRNLQRKLFREWVRRSKEHEEYVQALDLQAESRDFLTLKRQALDFWHTALSRKRQQVREERFFEHLYNRAGHAYDLFLLTKSFTHWIQITSGAMAKTNVARERFLFTKYFNSWCDFTVSTELKAERQRRKMPFTVLRRRAARYNRDQVRAVGVFQRNLTKNVFWRWFHEWCDRAAPRYHEQQLQRSTLTNWLSLARANVSREADFSAQSLCRLIQKIVQTWATKARIDVAGYHEADAFRKSHLLSPILMKWSAEARLRPLEGQLQRLQDWKIARNNFSIWQLRTRIFFHADTVNTKRIMQNAYTAWNEQLRSQALAGRINGRIVAEATYKWVMAQRLALMGRICQRRSRGRVARAFFNGVRQKCDQLVSQEGQFEVARTHQLLTSTFACWNRSKIADDTRTQIALNFYDPKVKQDTMEAIRLKLRHQEKLERWAQDARFYFLMTKHIARWRASSTEQRKNRERAAYRKMRQQCKLSLARNVLLTWRRKASLERDTVESSGLIYNQRIRTTLGILFLNWRAAASQRQRDVTQVSARYDSRLASRSLYSLIEVSRHLSNMQLRAEQYHYLKMSEICSDQLRRFSLRAFEIRRRDKDADAIHDRHWNKHVRNMIRHWAGRARDSDYKNLLESDVAATEKAEDIEPTDAGYGTASNEDHNAQSSAVNELGATRRAEEWTAFDHALLHQGSEWIPPPSFPSDDGNGPQLATSTPTPGYLNTPSKRAVRAKALADLTSTTPIAPPPPFRTPFAVKLRAGAGIGSFT